MRGTYTVEWDLLIDAVLRVGLDEDDLHPDYSGRGMYGEQCLGLVYPDTGKLIEFVIALVQADEDTGDWLNRVKLDQMGLEGIAYWPGVQASGAPEE